MLEYHRSEDRSHYFFQETWHLNIRVAGHRSFWLQHTQTALENVSINGNEMRLVEPHFLVHFQGNQEKISCIIYRIP